MRDMSRLAEMLMFLSWLLYGAIPAMASAPVTAPPEHAAHAASMETPSSAHQGHGHVSAASQADHERPPCPHGGRTCITPLCAACLTILPRAAGVREGLQHVSYPVPDLAQTLTPSDPGPLERPPRL
jgi:hypothetical protein